MAIFDCFQYFNEDHIVDLRLNILNENIDYFVISESTRTHQGKKKKLNFDINNFSKFKHKIIYLVADFENDIKFDNHKGGESLIEQNQRNTLVEGLKKAEDNDLILLSDSDEIPDMRKLNQIKPSTKFTAFSQKMFMYKLNLQNLNESNWIGSRCCKKKYFPEPQKFRNMKFKNYSFWRIDKMKFQIIKGGWHFSFLQTPDDIANKIQSYSHGEFNKDKFIDKNKIAEKIANNQDVFERGFELKKIEINEEYPDFIIKNTSNLSNWIV